VTGSGQSRQRPTAALMTDRPQQCFAISFGSKMFDDGVQKHIWWMDDAYV
jgi:hypothetical protein